MPTSSSGIRRSRPGSRSRASATALDWSPYEGIEVPGSVRHVLARGDHVVDDGRFTGDEHRGAYLPSGNVAAGAALLGP